VIISIIGGEDMKLLEVDEAANHIRELVDEDANIIWGSAFNPDLQGKIRVSVVATGIDGTGEVQSAAARSSYALGGSRAPKRPVLELPAEDEFELPAEAEMEREGQGVPAFAAEAEDEPLDLGTMASSSFDEEDEESEEYDDVDGIVDPLAGLRNDADAGEYGSAGEEDETGWASASERATDEPLDLGEVARPAQDELLLDADRLAAEDEPVRPMLGGGRRRGLVSGDGGGAGGGGSGGAGSTLFERMANLSRGGGGKLTDDEEEEEDDGDDSGSASLSIPRFLGRQNNQ
jgi:cell division protein FtsZ